MHASRLKLATLLGVVLVLLLGLQSDGPRQGRQGNAHYDAHEYREAIDAYRRGLQGYTSDATGDPVYTALQNNLGAALHRVQAYEEAYEAFEQALRAAATPEEVARAAYNAGNNAYRMGERDTALDYYRRALLAEPDHEPARHNYEFVKRQREQEQQGMADDSEENEQAPPDDGEGLQEGELAPQPDESTPSLEQMPGEDAEGTLNEQLLDELDDAPMTSEQAVRILEALELDELELMREAMRMRAPRRSVEKDW